MSASCACFSASRVRHLSCKSTISLRAVTSCWVRLSRSAVSSSFCFESSFTVFSCPSVRPAPCSTRRERLVISSLSCWMVSLARCSFSCDASTIFHAFSISFFSDAIVFWSSCDSFSAVCTFAAFATISWFSSRHFLINRFSLSCDFLSARCSFSYSTRKRSSDLSPTRSCSTSWKSRSSASNALPSKPISSKPSFFSVVMIARATEPSCSVQ
mmetsp:Transcript_44142/g.104525  ORF Transcript_44142/g.104525 Transcript_44142/m.104525 type:complete len:213 (+) Transcript_44142:2218-2856(+)